MQELGRDESECGPDREEPHHVVGPEHGIRPPEAEIDLDRRIVAGEMDEIDRV